MKISFFQNCIKFARPIFREKPANTFVELEKTLVSDVFQTGREFVNTQSLPKTFGAKTIEEVRNLHELPEIKERGIYLDDSVKRVLKNRTLVPSYEKLLTARNRTLSDYDISTIGQCLTPENSKYLDILLDTKVGGQELYPHEIGRIIRRLGHTDKTRLVEILTKEKVDSRATFGSIINAIEKEEKTLGLNKIKDPQMRNKAEMALGERPLGNAQEVCSAFYNIGVKLENVKDEKILSYVQENLNTQNLFSLEPLLDAYHISEGHYSSNIGEVSNFYAGHGAKHPENKKFLRKFLLSQNAQEANAARKNLNGNFLADFKNEEKLDGLKKYISENHSNTPEMTGYMYEKYYLDKLSPALKLTHQKILNEFGTMLFYVNNKKAPDLVYKELSKWKKAGGDDFIAPRIIDTSGIKESFRDKVAGFFCSGTNDILTNTDRKIVFDKVLTHEIMHENDRGGWCVDFGRIKAERTYQEELYKAGLKIRTIDYAYTNKREFLAVAAEGDLSRYSDEFKSALVGLGMPRWVLDMEVTNMTVKREAAKRASAMAKA